MSGQPVKTQSDANKFRNEYLETLGLQESINDMNLQANKNYLSSGQLPPQSQMQDTRTNAEKLADTEKMKREIADNLKPIAEPSFAYQIVNKVLESPLNLDNSLFRFLAQRVTSIVEQLKKILPYGIAGDANDLERIVEFIKNMYAEQQGKFQTTKSYLNSVSSQGSNSRVLSGNDIDGIILGLQDIIKSLSIVSESSGGVFEPLIMRISNMLIRLKRTLPTTEEIKLLLRDIENPNFNNPYPETLGLYEYNKNDMTAFFRLMEKLPKYSEVMALISKIKQYISSGNFNLVNQGLLNLEKMFLSVEGIKDNYVLEGFRRLKDRQQSKIKQAEKMNEVQTREFIKNQTAEEKNASRAQKVYVVNPSNDPVYISNPIDVGSLVKTVAPMAVAGAFAPASLVTPVVKGIINSTSGAFKAINQRLQDEIDDTAKLSDFRPISSSNNPLPNTPNDDLSFLRDVESITPTTQNVAESLKLTAQLIDNLSQDRIDGLIQLIDKPNVNDRNSLILELVSSGLLESEGESVIKDIILEGQSQGRGLKKKRRGRPRGSGIVKVIPPRIPNFVGFGVNEINQKQLKNGIVKIRRNTKTNYVDLPSKRVSSNLQKILNTIVGGGVPKYEELGKLDNDEKEYLHKLVSRSNLEDRLSVPAPSKDQQEKDIHNFEVMKGQIMSGNDSQELVKKFKLLIRKLSKQGLLPDKDVDDLIEVLADIGY